MSKKRCRPYRADAFALAPVRVGSAAPTARQCSTRLVPVALVSLGVTSSEGDECTARLGGNSEGTFPVLQLVAQGLAQRPRGSDHDPR